MPQEAIDQSGNASPGGGSGYWRRSAISVLCSRAHSGGAGKAERSGRGAGEKEAREDEAQAAEGDRAGEIPISFVLSIWQSGSKIRFLEAPKYSVCFEMLAKAHVPRWWASCEQVVAFEQKMAELQFEINRKMEAERRKQEAVQRWGVTTMV